ncbi:MAG: ATP-binding cassette domain-containing protein [Oscillospiraceae bacterium]|nr:ATP-binding cassette domain-containing protein [Oscillospiraceae bacterium]
MLLINETLVRMSKGFRVWILTITAMKLIVLLGVNKFATSIGTILGQLFNGGVTIGQLRMDLFGALIGAAIILVGDLLVGEAEYRCTAKARISLREQILQKVLELDVGDIDKLGTTATINAAVDGVELMLIYYNKYLPGLLYCVIAPIMLFFFIIGKSVPAAILLLTASLIITPINNIFKVINDRMKGDYWNTLNKLTECYLENINGLTTAELFNRGLDREKKLDGIAQHLKDIIVDVMTLNFSSTALNEFLINATIVSSAAVVCNQLISGKLGLVQALTVLLLSYSFFGSIRALQWIAHDALHGVAAAHSVADILAVDTTKPVSKDKSKHNDFIGIKFENVSFGYKERKKVLENVNIEIAHNKVTAIVGESGSGKSTIVNMLLRFYDTDTGRITFDGRDYLSIPPEELRKKIIMVPQSVFVFGGTLRENLLISNINATDDELWEVLEQVKLKQWAESTQEKLDVPVGDAGSRLSGGQRQKVGIARALLSKAEYIIFDEATSSVDEESEREIWSCIGRLAQTRTLIIISHRLSTIKNADVIYLIDKGIVDECGSHDQLMLRNGKYAALVTEQNELENHVRRSVAN